MALTVSIILTGIAIGLLLIYGADYAAGGHIAGQGFLPLDAMTRGLALGGPSVVLPIIGFFISRKEPSKPLGIMLIITGILVLIGGISAIAGASNAGENATRFLAEGGSLVAIGGIISILGIIKLKKSWNANLS